MAVLVAKVRRGFVVLAVLASAGSCLAVLSLPWLTAMVPVAPGSPARVPVELSGAQCLPAAQALALVSAAAGIGLLATRTWGIRLVASVTALAGLAILVLAAKFALDGSASPLPPDAVLLRQSAWWLIAALSGLVTATAGLAAMRLAGSWQRPPSAYQRSNLVEPIKPGLSSSEVASRAAWWDALDRGEDPSQVEPSQVEPSPADPGPQADKGLLG